MLRRLLPPIVYLLLTGGALLFCAIALAHHWPLWAIAVAITAASMAAVSTLERVIPYSEAWTRSHGDGRTDFFHFVFSNRAFDVGALIGVVAFAPLGSMLSRRYGGPWWPHAWPVAAQTALALVIAEFSMYWIHRLEHSVEPLWRLHSVHHSAPRMHWWNLARNHPLDNLLSASLSVAPLAFLGVSDAPLAFMAAFSGAHAMLQHSNVDQRTGALDWIFTTARVHRFHHSRDLGDVLANYGPTLTLWDHVFGTRRFAATAIPPEDLGLDGSLSEYPTGYLGQLRAPFNRQLWRARSSDISPASPAALSPPEGR